MTINWFGGLKKIGKLLVIGISGALVLHFTHTDFELTDNQRELLGTIIIAIAASINTKGKEKE